MDWKTRMWGAGASIRVVGKRVGITGPLDGLMWRVSRRLLAPPERETVAQLSNGMMLTLPPGLANARTYLSGTFEPAVTSTLQTLIRGGMTVVDVGANVGYYTLLASELVGVSGKVIAIEPDERMYSYLERNIGNNACPNVITMPVAVSDQAGMVSFRSDPGGTDGAISGDSGRPVQAISLDSIQGRVDVLKMDIEGGELHALQGMRDLISRNPHAVMIMEYHLAALERSGANREALAAALRSLGYHEARIIETGATYRVDELPRHAGVCNLLLRRPEGATSESDAHTTTSEMS